LKAQHPLILLNRLKRWRLETVSFVTGFSLLTYELAAARVLAPSIGSSTYVWTGVIGVIIAALSLGFIIGGRIADRRDRLTDLVWLLLLASGMAVLTLLGYQGLLESIVDGVEDSRLQAVTAALLLFAPCSFFIGMTSPYLAKLNVRTLKSTGQAVASLDSFNAVGGIVGTFMTGFLLFGFIGSHQTIGLVAILLLLASWLIAPRLYVGKRLIVSAVLLLCALTPASSLTGQVRIDTASAHYQVFSGIYKERLITGLTTGPTGTQSAVYQNGLSDPVFWYAQQMTRLTVDRHPRTILMLGGGAFTMPQYLSERLPDARIDVVEIDPQLASISRQYFNYRDPHSVTATFTDARTYVNRSDKRYDVVLVDVYGDTSIPFTFMTKEYGAALAKLLTPDGVVIANIIGGLEGKCRDTLAAVDAAYRTSLPHVLYANESGRPEARANHVVVYSKQVVAADGLAPLPDFDAAAYTDDFAPAERLFYDCQQSSKKA